MKLVIQIPCWNEEEILPKTLRSIPQEIAGFDSIDILVVDDGSTDRTAEIARSFGITHIHTLSEHRGLATAFREGLKHAVDMGADIIVNLDADNQYNADDIEHITCPILEGRTKVAIGERDIPNLIYFSALKRRLHFLGNLCIRFISGLPVTDATSGFRAIHKDIAPTIQIYSTYTYTIEMVLFLAFNRIPVEFVPIRSYDKALRPSRLIRSNAQYIGRTFCIIIRTLLRYRPYYVLSVTAIALLMVVYLL